MSRSTWRRISSAGCREAVPINDTLEKMVAKGWLGKKSGRGFYVYEGKKRTAARPSDLAFPAGRRSRASSDDATQRDRLVLIMINEAARVLAEGVVDSPEDVDFGMIMGTGWAPFRGGPLRYADSLGADEIVRRLESWRATSRRISTVRTCATGDAGTEFYRRRWRSRDPVGQYYAAPQARAERHGP